MSPSFVFTVATSPIDHVPTTTVIALTVFVEHAPPVTVVKSVPVDVVTDVVLEVELSTVVSQVVVEDVELWTEV